MRSAGVAWLLDLYGFKVYTLIGGYKQYRQYVLATFEIPFQFKIIGGYTGSGKTGLLKVLKSKGQQVIDLEEIASHKGSAFGNIGMPDQPGQEMFENLLATELHKLRTKRTEMISTARFSFSADEFPPIWLEDESQRIGLVNLPNHFWNNMRQAPLWFLDIPFAERLKQIVQEYGQLDQERMIGAIGRITEKLGHLNAKNAVLYLKEGKISESFEILLKYYDKFYLRSLHNRAAINSLLQTVDCKSITPENADLLINQTEFQPQKL
jgi:tRNA 2-selenouridine synthase